MNSQEYFNWLSKFESKYGTDECFTPPAVYDVVLDYVNNHIISLDGLSVVRPFYPNGDYQKEAENYDDNTIVIDNPPFSILAKIIDYYVANNIKFFLFAPALTVFSPMRKNDCTAIIAPTEITYANGAVVNTAFVTNTLDGVRAITAPQLYKSLQDLENKEKRKLPKYCYPKNVLMVNELQKLCKAGIEFSIRVSESVWIDSLDSQKPYKKELFGGGFLINNEKSKELQDKLNNANKETFVWELSQRELDMVGRLGEVE